MIGCPAARKKRQEKSVIRLDRRDRLDLYLWPEAAALTCKNTMSISRAAGMNIRSL